MKPRYIWTPAGPQLKVAPVRTPVDFVSELQAQHMCVADWARSKGFRTRAVYSVITGHHVGRRGKAREILRAMGIQPPPMQFRSEPSSATP